MNGLYSLSFQVNAIKERKITSIVFCIILLKYMLVFTYHHKLTIFPFKKHNTTDAIY